MAKTDKENNKGKKVVSTKAKKKDPKKAKNKIVKKRKVQKGQSEWSERKPVVIFAASFLAICLLFYLITNMDWLSAGILNIFGADVTSRAEIISSDDFSVSIEEGCDAIAPAILYAISVAIFPIATRTKWRGLFLGLLAIAVLNIIRIVSLYFTGVHAPSLFEFMHVDFWQAIFIVFTAGIWIYWMRWASAQTQPLSESPAV